MANGSESILACKEGVNLQYFSVCSLTDLTSVVHTLTLDVGLIYRYISRSQKAPLRTNFSNPHSSKPTKFVKRNEIKLIRTNL